MVVSENPLHVKIIALVRCNFYGIFSISMFPSSLGPMRCKAGSKKIKEIILGKTKTVMIYVNNLFIAE